MIRAGWKCDLWLGDDKLEARHLRKPAKGGLSKFNDINIGLLVGHGIHGESIDNVATNTGAFQSYFPIYKTGATNYDWVRLSECDFGSSNLRWMAIFACNILHDVSFNDMYTKGVLPINNQLHLLLSAKTSVYMHPDFGPKWALYMTGRDGGIRSVRQAWIDAGRATQARSKPAATVPEIVFRTVGWPACFNDKLLDYSPPDSGDPFDLYFEDEQVYPE